MGFERWQQKSPKKLMYFISGASERVQESLIMTEWRMKPFSKQQEWGPWMAGHILRLPEEKLAKTTLGWMPLEYKRNGVGQGRSGEAPSKKIYADWTASEEKPTCWP